MRRARPMRPDRCRTRYLAGALALLIGGACDAALVTQSTTTLNVTLNDISLMGMGSVPLAASGDPNVNGGYQNAGATIAVTSSGTPSTGTIVMETVLDTDTTVLTLSYASDFVFNLDVDITAKNNDFAGAQQIHIPAASHVPLAASLGFSVPSTDFAGILAGTVAPPPLDITVNEIEHSLGTDINGNSVADSIYFNALAINWAAVDGISFDFASSPGINTLEDILLAGLFDPNLTLDGTVSVQSFTVQFVGRVDDSVVDPPFGLELQGSVNPIPLPAALPLLAVSLGALFLPALWRHRNAGHVQGGADRLQGRGIDRGRKREVAGEVGLVGGGQGQHAVLALARTDDL